jgi:hypothetical protein
VRLRIGTATAAALLFLGGALGLLGGWSLGIGVGLLVAASVSMAIAMEERGGAPTPAPVPARTEVRSGSR